MFPSCPPRLGPHNHLFERVNLHSARLKAPGATAQLTASFPPSPFAVACLFRLPWFVFFVLQALRHPDCQDECALCVDGTSPCQNCFQDKPAITKCDDPSSRVFFDAIHFTTHFQLVFGEAIRQCSKDAPNFDRPLVSVMCPPEVA